MNTSSRKLKRIAGVSVAVTLLCMFVSAWPAIANAQSPSPVVTPSPRQPSAGLPRSTASTEHMITPAAGTVKSDSHPSPNGQFMATIPFYAGRVIMTARDGRRAEWAWPKWFAFVGWTSDSRFAIMNYYDQYGNTWGQAFDTRKWALIELVSVVKGHTPSMPTMEGDCKEGAKAISKDGSGILLFNGAVVALMDLAK